MASSSSETTLLKLLESQAKHMESQVNYQQQMLTILTSVDNKLSALINHNDGTTVEVGNNPASDSGQQVKDEGNHSRHYVIPEHQQLYDAAKDGNWGWAEQFFRDHPGMMTVEITNDQELALHIAADHTKWEFVENLIQLMPPEALDRKDSKHGFTALHTTAMEGNTKVAELMVGKNGTLTQIRDKRGRVPLHTAAKYVSDGQTELLKYLYQASDKEVFADPLGASLLCDLIDSNFYEIDLSLLQRFPHLVTEKTEDSGACALEVLVRRPFSFRSGNKTAWWQNRIYPFLQMDTTAPDEPGRSTACQMDPTAPTDLPRNTGSRTDTAASSDLGNSTGQLDGMSSNDNSRFTVLQVGLASPNDLGSNLVFQVSTIAPNGISSSTVIQVDAATPNELGRNTILELDIAAPSNLGSNTVLQMDLTVSSNDLCSTAVPQVGAPDNERGSSTVLQVDTTTPDNFDRSTVPQADTTTDSDLDRAGTENRLTGSSMNFLTMCRETISKLILVHPVTCLTRVPLIKKLRKQKLINKQASELVSSMLEQIDLTKNKSDVLDFFKTSSLMKTAIKNGTTEVVELCLEKFPYLIWSEMEGQSMVQIAVRERNEKVFNFLCKKSEEDMDELNHRIDGRGNSILHHAANIAPSTQLNLVSGAALQMQREMQWFKAVEFILLERYRRVRNKEGYTAQQIFIDEHKGLVKEGEKWMRYTSQSCMLVATLISTVVFAAAFTVPGGSYNDANRNINGLPILLNKNSFIVFAITDALALFSSITSILMFLAILTSRYSEEDFLRALPQKFILGLSTLFFSLATMMISFGSAVNIMVCQRLAWIIVPIAMLGCIPVTLFVWLLFPLFVEMIHSTYWPTKLHQRTTKRKVN
ncbi:ankyrin repeat-containing protein ITN1-like isoform X1 [Papaver somniferum]|uniref:ankyrin repeat-containing protein ITN1-like isoform X1 n=1 Tax=Papaver somniferum TaxID=3469 RepID=UPI000E6F4F3C|nr:ankyrin repeat-containing protein ITN1-like isoform X1 [Papaver somniferum]